MEHVCHQCGASVEDGRPFCRQCNGPQIRVAIAEAEPVSVASDEHDEASGEFSQASLPAAYPDTHFRAAYKTSFQKAGSINFPRAWSAAAVAVLLAAGLTIIPFGAPVGLGILVGGFLSVFFYRRKNPSPNLSLGTGFKLGALSGILGYAFSVAFLGLGTSTFHAGGDFHKKLLDVLQQHSPAGADAQLQQVMDFYKTSQGFTVMLVIGLVMALAAFLVLSGLGGLIGAAVLKRKDSL